jgi:hypothetical protein
LSAPIDRCTWSCQRRDNGFLQFNHANVPPATAIHHLICIPRTRSPHFLSSVNDPFVSRYPTTMFQGHTSKELGYLLGCHPGIDGTGNVSGCSAEGYRRKFDQILEGISTPLRKEFVPVQAEALRKSGASSIRPSFDYCQILTIDATPSYLIKPKLAERLHAAPLATHVLLLRNPVTRYASMYNFQLFHLLKGKHVKRNWPVSVLRANISKMIQFETDFMAQPHVLIRLKKVGEHECCI